MASERKRLVAYKLWIRDIYAGTFIRQSDLEPNHLLLNGKQVFRVNLLATVVSKFNSEDGNYSSVTLDDGTETIRVKAFGPDVAKIKEAPLGTLARFIGKVREYNDELYLAPEALYQIKDPNWVIVHKLELGAPVSGETSPQEVAPEIGEAEATEAILNVDISVQEKILELLKAHDTGKGADMQEVISNSGLSEEEARNILVGLLNAGDVYEPEKGRLKVL